MTGLFLQYLKLFLLIALIGSIIGLSHFNGESNGSSLAAARHAHSPARARKILVVTGRLAPAADGRCLCAFLSDWHAAAAARAVTSVRLRHVDRPETRM